MYVYCEKVASAVRPQMSDLSESGSSGLSDWALVNSQGELEVSCTLYTCVDLIHD